MKSENKAIVEMLICATLWSIAGIFIKFLPWSGFALASLRSLVAGLTILAYMAIAKIPFRFNKHILITGILTGCVYTCFVVSNKLTTAANAIVLQFTSPVFIVILSSIFFRQKFKKADYITVILTLAGITLTFLDNLESGYVAGNLVAIGAGLFMAGMFVFVGDLDSESRFSAVFLGQMFTFLIGLPSVIITRPALTHTALASILILGIFQLGISYVLYVRASKYCPPLACCLLGVIEPLLNPVWVMIFAGETPGHLAMAGGLIVIITVTVWCALGNAGAKDSSAEAEAEKQEV